MIGLLRRWSCKGHSSLTQGNICMFIQFSQEMELQVGDTGEASAYSLFMSSGRQSPLSQYDSHVMKSSCKGHSSLL